MRAGAFPEAESLITLAGLPDEARIQLEAASRAYGDGEVALAHLQAAQALAPEHLAVAVGLYRFYFYKGRRKEALASAEACLGLAGKKLLLHQDWRRVAPNDAPFASFDAPIPRLYLFILKAMAYLHLSAGRHEEGLEILAKLFELDPQDLIQAQFLRKVLGGSTNE